jgi:hypothetical protein
MTTTLMRGGTTATSPTEKAHAKSRTPEFARKRAAGVMMKISSSKGKFFHWFFYLPLYRCKEYTFFFFFINLPDEK